MNGRRSTTGKRTWKVASLAWLNSGPARHDRMPLLVTEKGRRKTVYYATASEKISPSHTRSAMLSLRENSREEITHSPGDRGGALSAGQGNGKRRTPKKKPIPPVLRRMAWSIAYREGPSLGLEPHSIAPTLGRWLRSGADSGKAILALHSCLVEARKLADRRRIHIEAAKSRGEEPKATPIIAPSAYGVFLWRLTSARTLLPAGVELGGDTIAEVRAEYRRRREWRAAEAAPLPARPRQPVHQICELSADERCRRAEEQLRALGVVV